MRDSDRHSSFVPAHAISVRSFNTSERSSARHFSAATMRRMHDELDPALSQSSACLNAAFAIGSRVLEERELRRKGDLIDVEFRIPLPTTSFVQGLGSTIRRSCFERQLARTN